MTMPTIPPAPSPPVYDMSPILEPFRAFRDNMVAYIVTITIVFLLGCFIVGRIIRFAKRRLRTMHNTNNSYKSNTYSSVNSERNTANYDTSEETHKSNYRRKPIPITHLIITLLVFLLLDFKQYEAIKVALFFGSILFFAVYNILAKKG